MKSILTKIHILSFLCALPALANDVGLHNSSAQPTRAAPGLVIPEASDIESVINYARSLAEGEVEMDFTADVPYVQVQQASATASKIAQAGNPKPIEFEGDCQEVGNAEDDAGSAYNQFGVGLAVFSSLGYRIDNATGNFILPEQVRAGFKSYVISSPAHGEIFQTVEGKKNFYYSYRANEGYVGKDSFVIGVDTLTKSGKSIHFKIKFKLSVVEQITNENEQSTCVGMKFNSASDATAR